EIIHATLVQTKPEAAAQRISGQRAGSILISQPGPGNALDHIPAGESKETGILVGDPEIPGSVFGNTIHHSAWKALYRNKSVTLQLAEFAMCGNPNSPARILKKRLRSNSIAFPVAPAERGDLSVLPLVQVTSTREPDTSIPGRQDGPSGIRQALFHRKRRDGKFPKAVETVIGADPNVALTILKEALDVFARKAVRLRKHICPTVVDVNQAPAPSSEPQAAIAIAEQLRGSKLRRKFWERIRHLRFSIHESSDSALHRY